MRNPFRLLIFVLLVPLLFNTALAQASAAEAQKHFERIYGLPAFNLIAFFAYLVAALICTAFFVWTLKGRLIKQSLGRSDWIELFFLLFCSLWFYLLFILSAKGNIPYMRMRDFGILELSWFLWLAFWPAVVYHAAGRSAEKIRLHKFYKGVFVYFYLSGIALAGVFFYAFMAYRLQRFALCNSLLMGGSHLFLVNFVLCVLLIFFKSMKMNKEMKSAREEPEVKSSRQWAIFMWALWLFAVWPLMLVAMFGIVSIREHEKYINLLATLMPLPFIIVDMYYQARYMFVDIFIKKSDVAIVTGLITALYYIFVVEKFSRSGVWKSMKYPALLILLPLIIVIPFLARGVERLVDTYLFKRKFTPSEALSNFSRAIRFISDEKQLLAVAKSHLTDIFSTKNVMIFFSEEAGPAFSSLPKLKEELTRARRPILANEIQYSETADFCKENAIEVIVPLMLEEKIVGCIALGKRYYKEPYLSEDINLLNSIADQLGFALENIRLERKRREQERKEQELKILAGKAELRALRAQINPHFLFNTLNTIASLVKLNPNKAEQTVEMLSDIFRYTLAKSRVDFVPLIEEVNFIRAYLEVEKARFGDKLQVEISIDPQAEETKVPSMILQPLVENAIKHGIAPKIEGGKLEISATRADGFLNLKIKDDGTGFDASKSQRLNNDGVGFKNVRDRIYTVYGSRGYLQIHSEPNDGTTVLIKIPIQ